MNWGVLPLVGNDGTCPNVHQVIQNNFKEEGVQTAGGNLKGKTSCEKWLLYCLGGGHAFQAWQRHGRRRCSLLGGHFSGRGELGIGTVKIKVEPYYG